MKPPPKTKTKKVRRQSLATMLQAEAKLHAALKASLVQATAVSTGPFVAAAIAQAASNLTKALEPVILQGRSLARAKGHEGLKKELDLVNQYAPQLGGEVERAAHTAAGDAARARYLAARFSRLWSEEAIKQATKSDSKSPGQIIRNTNQKRMFHLNAVAVSEPANAWNDERQYEMQALVSTRQEKRRGLPLILAEEWSAVMDLRTCPECADLNGGIRPIGFSWPHGFPPVHVNCRCALLLAIVPAYFEWDEDVGTITELKEVEAA